jgi:hypothetical protein
MPNRPRNYPDSFRPEMSGKARFPGCDLFLLREWNVRTGNPGEVWSEDRWTTGTPPPSFARVNYSLQWCRAGWPFRCLSGGEWTDQNTAKAGVSHITFNAMPIGVYSYQLPSVQGALLPMQPIWLGVTANTLLYAAGCWALFHAPSAPFAMRRWLRLRRNLCPHCAYPVGTSDVCTECGKAVKLTKSLPHSLPGHVI